MIVDNYREKLLQIITFFVTQTKYCGKTKLYKLLYFADFGHYSEVGRSITGLNYFAWKMGPVPKSLHNELEGDAEDLSARFSIEMKGIGPGKKMLAITPKTEFDTSLFSRRELRILKSLATEYSGAFADDMVEATHLENLPWHQVYETDNNKLGVIPYSYAYKSAEKEEMEKMSADQQDVLRNYK